eukprot:489456-Rhodomonas_salina.1
MRYPIGLRPRYAIPSTDIAYAVLGTEPDTGTHGLYQCALRGTECTVWYWAGVWCALCSTELAYDGTGVGGVSGGQAQAASYGPTESEVWRCLSPYGAENESLKSSTIAVQCSLRWRFNLFDLVCGALWYRVISCYEATSLRACYAMSGTDVAYAAISRSKRPSR